MTTGKRAGPTTNDVKKIAFMLSMKFRWRQIPENGQNRYADTFQLMSEDEKDITLSSLAKSFTDYIYKGYDENYAYIAALTDEFGGS